MSGILLQPAFAHAAGGLQVCGGSEDPSSVQKFQSTSCQLEDIFKLIANITNYLMATAGLFAVVWVVIAGFRLVAAAGNEAMIKQGKKGLTNAVLGFVLVMISYIIVNTLFTAIGSRYGITYTQTLFRR